MRFISPPLFVGLFVLVAAFSPVLAQDDDVAAFFRGKTVRIVVGVGVGSGYDINARLLARIWYRTFPAHRA
jgi:tripartite-type tricarboxylate transporter receptor subunit TctC